MTQRAPEPLDRLVRALDELSWQDQVEREFRERHPDLPPETTVDDTLRLLARWVTPQLLDALERTPGYVTWVLRLSPLVPGDRSAGRAERHRYDPSPEVRYWAARLRDPPPDGGLTGVTRP